MVFAFKGLIHLVRIGIPFKGLIYLRRGIPFNTDIKLIFAVQAVLTCIKDRVQATQMKGLRVSFSVCRQQLFTTKLKV